MMKKHFKKLVNLALTAVMVMGMSTTDYSAAAKPPVRKNGNHLSG